MPCSSCDRIQQKTTTPVGEEEGDRWSKEVSFSSCRNTQPDREGTETELLKHRSSTVIFNNTSTEHSYLQYVYIMLPYFIYLYIAETKAQNKRQVEDPATARSRVRGQGRSEDALYSAFTHIYI